MRPLKSVISPEDRKIIFLHITVWLSCLFFFPCAFGYHILINFFRSQYFAEIHTGFHSDLYKACTSSQHQISECFLHWREKFIVYGDYCSNLPVAQELMDDLCCKNETINQAVHVSVNICETYYNEAE